MAAGHQRILRALQGKSLGKENLCEKAGATDQCPLPDLRQTHGDKIRAIRAVHGLRRLPRMQRHQTTAGRRGGRETEQRREKTNRRGLPGLRAWPPRGEKRPFWLFHWL